MKASVGLTLICLLASCRGTCVENTDNGHHVRQKRQQSQEAKPKPVINTCVHRECCDDRTAVIDLDTGMVYPNFPSGITIQGPISNREGKCKKTGLLKVNFEALSTRCTCTSVPFFGRTMLKLDVYLAPGNDTRSYFMLTVGDSITNNGYGGDAVSQFYDAEINFIFPNIVAYTNDFCKKEGYGNRFVVIKNALLAGIDKVTLYIANGYTRVVYGNNERTICSKCLFGLNNQEDIRFGVNVANTDLYISLNTVVNMSRGRNGAGVCRIEASWVCPVH